ncbi:hypothetical protein GGU11DRAFT_375451 [Lentinula aff. detonsa]|nr:hypothetical protein GGU11DRAFT_375451 [Lentinula aff. detonsa]
MIRQPSQIYLRSLGTYLLQHLFQNLHPGDQSCHFLHDIFSTHRKVDFGHILKLFQHIIKTKFDLLVCNLLVQKKRIKKREWRQNCPGVPKLWLGAFYTCIPHKTESLVHLALEALCYSRPRYWCCCGTVHTEKFIFKGDMRSVYEELLIPVINTVISFL